MTGEPKCAPWPALKRGLVAILRGIHPDEILSVSEVLLEAGIEAIEIPLNSPDPFISIEMLAKAHGDAALIGAGTVLTSEDVDRLNDAGGKLLVSPNVDADVIGTAVRHGMVALPGIFTPTEALAALKAGASGLKFFPANALGPSGISAIQAILPKDAVVAAVGGVDHHSFVEYAEIGVSKFGLGSSLYKPGRDVAQIAERAQQTVEAWDRVFTGAFNA